jgi:hypothetical protein
VNPASPPRARLTTTAQEELLKAGFSRAALVAALTAIHVHMPATASVYRQHRRIPGRPHLFSYDQRIIDQGRVRTLWLVVGDAGWPNLLWVVDLFVVDGPTVP